MGGTHVSSRGSKGATALLRVQAEASPRTRCLGRVQGLCECDGPCQLSGGGTGCGRPRGVGSRTTAPLWC